MKPLRVGLVTKGSERALWREDRPLGWWSYPVPEFEWVHLSVKRGSIFHVDAQAELGNFDLIVHEDWGGPVTYMRKRVLVVFTSYDSTLTDKHYMSRLSQSLQADMVLVDHDQLHRFAHESRPVYRGAHAVNDHLFKPVGAKLCDVSFHCSGGDWPGAKERARLRVALNDICRGRGYSLRTGVLEVKAYARSMAESRVVVNLPRTPTNRPHRVFDTMACGTALLTGSLPAVSGDRVEVGTHYLIYNNLEELDASLNYLLDGRAWETMAEVGYARVMNDHAWTVRAAQFRQLLFEEFKL